MTIILKKDSSNLQEVIAVNLWEAPFIRPLEILDLAGLPEEARLVLSQLGVDEGELVCKQHKAPLGDPVTLLIGNQSFTLRAEICRKILVETR